MKYTNRFCRGQVWFISKNLTNDLERQSNVTDGARPYLIISNNTDNINLGYVTMLACSKRSNGGEGYYTDVAYHSNYGKCTAVILCNQVRMVPKQILENYGKYIETVNDEILSEVETSYLKVLGINRDSKSEFPSNEAVKSSVESFNKCVWKPEAPKNKRAKWTKNKKKKFCNDYESIGIEETAKKYNLKIKSTKNMYYKYRKEI